MSDLSPLHRRPCTASVLPMIVVGIIVGLIVLSSVAATVSDRRHIRAADLDAGAARRRLLGELGRHK